MTYSIQNISDLASSFSDAWEEARDGAACLDDVELPVEHQVEWKYAAECCWTDFWFWKSDQSAISLNVFFIFANNIIIDKKNICTFGLLTNKLVRFKKLFHY